MRTTSFNQRHPAHATALPQKSAMEDFLFILVISLAVAISMFSKKQQAERFAIPDGKPTEQTISMEQYANLIQCELPEGSVYRLDGTEFTDATSMVEHIQNQAGDTSLEILLRISRTRQIGEVEDLRNQMFDRGWKIYTEWEKQQ